MYKSILALVVSATMLTACNHDLANEKPTEQKETKADPERNKWSSLPEYDEIIEQIGNEDYSFDKETDNADKRVFLIEQNGTKRYKTIFVKKTNRLKIIKINGGGAIYDEIIK
ncbi:hypothetical protein GW626_19480 [Peribacillus muralis]|uniref:hypothetical protein n=1 Tax=Peribacillus muralis TaxID=264697 RepID=UPI001F4DFF28|nr:hypothetical protein [Peribacillus muralis]MCK1994791.1 hypothetical protein [Peribacillus muralis]MCK2015382.1 hypothetical protein [Peribacillus muralis]